MACLQIGRSGFSPVNPLRFGLLNRRFVAPSSLISCRVQENSGGDSKGEEEAPESLFMKELKRRGMKPTSLLEEGKRSGGVFEVEDEIEEGKEGEKRGKKRKKKMRNGVLFAEYNDKGMADQRERSMSLNSEGLEGLLPRAKLLLTIGGTFFWGFWPLMLITTASFAALYFC